MCICRPEGREIWNRESNRKKDYEKQEWMRSTGQYLKMTGIGAFAEKIGLFFIAMPAVFLGFQ